MDAHNHESEAVSCPQCEHPLPPDARTCPNCGVDLALVALLAERAYLEGVPGAAPVEASPAALVPRIGEFLLQQSLITPAQLDAALKRQKELAARNERRLLGETMVEMGYVDRETLDRAINRQIIELHAALQEANRNLERRVAERTAELRRALDRLKELNQIKANLISNVSHELRTPLAHIKGYIELLADAELGPITEQQEGAVKVIQRASERLGQLIEDLIEFSTASREGLSLRMGPVDLDGIVDDIIERSREKADSAGVNLKKEIESPIPPLKADQERLAWVIYQLVDNGIKFTPEGGTVVISSAWENGQILTSVKDSGIGIPADKLEEIYEPFHQLDGSATRRYGGTGLGLALVRLILNTHGTEIVVKSEDGRGSTFSFRLPSAEDEA